MTDEVAEQPELAAQMQAATEAIEQLALGLLRKGEVHPQLLILSLARVTGELAAGATLAGGEDVERVLGEVAEFLQEAGRAHHDMLQLEVLPVAGSA